MNNYLEPNPIRIPVKLAGKQWEYFYGGHLPIRDGAVGDLIVDKCMIEDSKFVANLKHPSKHKILEAGTSLLVALTIRKGISLNENLKKHLQSKDNRPDLSLGDAYYSKLRSPHTQFVTVTIGPPNERQKRLDPEHQGGVWLHMEGHQPKGVSSSTVSLPEDLGNEPADSLNHAFTLLSEKYEPWRKSHTGNIYQRILYQEENKKWYPLEMLRNAALAKDELRFIRERWTQICENLSINP